MEIQPEVKPGIDVVYLTLTADEAKFVHAVLGTVSQNGIFALKNDEWDNRGNVSVHSELGNKLYEQSYFGNSDEEAWKKAALKWVINGYRGYGRIE